jgi:hypothetical protein
MIENNSPLALESPLHGIYQLGYILVPKPSSVTEISNKYQINETHFIPLVSMWKSYSVYLTPHKADNQHQNRTREREKDSRDIFIRQFAHIISIRVGNTRLFPMLLRQIDNGLMKIKQKECISENLKAEGNKERT